MIVNEANRFFPRFFDDWQRVTTTAAVLFGKTTVQNEIAVSKKSTVQASLVIVWQGEGSAEP